MNTEKVIANMRADVIGCQDEIENVHDKLDKVELLFKLAAMRLKMVEGTIDLKLESLNLRLEKLEHVTS